MWWRREPDPYSQYYASSDERSINRFVNLQKVMIALAILCVMLFLKKIDLPQTSAIITRVHRAITYEMDLAKFLDGIKNQKFIRDIPALKSVFEKETSSLPSRGFIPPLTGKVTSGFGRRFHPLLKVERMHNGIDIEELEGTPVKAAASGTVIQAAEDAELGRLVKIRHEGDVVTVYAHLKDVYVKTGDRVSQGQIIGTVGKTGLAENPHLHFEIWEKGMAQDPEKWLEISEKP
ncbi:Murein DD-endopeptidase MepM [Fervidicola ferrireducens]|uniref:Murein DD-endopeptidase MepM n=1 Tax=Fervidicola ferrireducens TaxID=520764 RepID=A0A140LA76_9FIRM|nr:M23 family metallopeptidase [Fervidicola ferrireducens]KXG77451.1 Murein DD-endopeptidase MepM [Fervidicola ferrireducens]